MPPMTTSPGGLQQPKAPSGLQITRRSAKAGTVARLAPMGFIAPLSGAPGPGGTPSTHEIGVSGAENHEHDAPRMNSSVGCRREAAGGSGATPGTSAGMGWSPQERPHAPIWGSLARSSPGSARTTPPRRPILGSGRPTRSPHQSAEGRRSAWRVDIDSFSRRLTIVVR